MSLASPIHHFPKLLTSSRRPPHSFKQSLFLPIPSEHPITPHPLLCRASTSTNTSFNSLRSPQYNQILPLPSGRVLGFAEFGHPTGYPLLFFHGFPSSRKEAFGLDALARRRGLRVIAPDRPGFGLSSPHPDRRITDWPDDVQALVEHVGVSKFAILGGSGGGPYALACARVMSPRSLEAVGVLAGAPPWWAPGGRRQMLMRARVAAWLARWWPGGLEWFAGKGVGAFRWLIESEEGRKVMQAVLGRMKREMEKGRMKEGGAGEKGTLAEEPARKDAAVSTERMQRTMEILLEGFTQGPGAFVHEARLLTAQDWGFRFEDVTYNPIKLWHGTDDRNAPISMIRYMADRLPYGILREMEGESHFTVAKRTEEVLLDLIPDNTLAKSSRGDLKS